MSLRIATMKEVLVFITPYGQTFDILGGGAGTGGNIGGGGSGGGGGAGGGGNFEGGGLPQRLAYGFAILIASKTLLLSHSSHD